MFALLFLLAFPGCRETGSPESSGDTSANTENQNDTSGLPSNVTVSLPGQYSLPFLHSLAEMDTLNFELQGGALILDGRDTLPMPTHPPLHQITAYFGRLDDLTEIKLLVERINWTSLNYRIMKGVNHQLDVVLEGRAELPVSFVVGGHPSESAKEMSMETILSLFQDENPECPVVLYFGKGHGRDVHFAGAPLICGGGLEWMSSDPAAGH